MEENKIPEKILLHRIIHIDNLDYILDLKKLTCPNHPEKDPNYIGIGDSTLIQSRSQTEIPLAPNGTFNDYISFYFSNRTPMLYNIYHGYQNVVMRPQEDIIYLVSTYKKIKESERPFVFFSGHGYHHLSGCYNEDSGLSEIDWEVINSKKWADKLDGGERKRKKQAELLVSSELSIDYLVGIGVFNFEVQQKILCILQEKVLNLKCKIMQDWYY
jgi:hypothetical protein